MTFTTLILCSLRRCKVWTWHGSRWRNINRRNLNFNVRLILINRIRFCSGLWWYKCFPKTWSSCSTILWRSFTVITWHLLELKRASSTVSSLFQTTLYGENLTSWQKLRSFFSFVEKFFGNKTQRVTTL